MRNKEENYNIIDWFKKVVFENYANFEGRARRKEYWMFTLASVIISLILVPIDIFAGLTIGEAGGNGILGTIKGLILLVPGIAVAVRRMHDVGKSGWYMLIPIYNLVLACTDSEHGSNEYGVNPKLPDNELNEIGSNQY
jgi:uncharacterized membrane protein YhaH (DUF805 family)